jgi:hypothetical protein
MEKELRVKILQSSAGSSVISLLPFVIREFHRARPMVKFITVAGLFAGANYALMRDSFEEYISECRKVAQRHIGKLMEDSALPL